MASIPATILAIRNTAPKYLAGVIDQTKRNRFLLKWLESQGRILYNEKAVQHIWNVKARKPEVENAGGNTPVVFKTHNTNEQLSITHASMRSSSAIDRETYTLNDSPQAIVKLTEDMLYDLTSTLADAMNDSLYTDNTADPTLITGIGSIMKTHASLAATDRVAVPSATATYGGKNIKLGALGGRWSARLAAADRASSVHSNDWPDGNGDPQYDYLAPKMYNYTGAWQTGTNNWRTNGERILRRSRITMKALAGNMMTPTLHLLAPEMLADFQDSLVNRERLVVSDYAKSLGFNGVLEFEGAVLQEDYSCPSGRGYGINPKEMALYSCGSDLFYIDGPSWETLAQAYVMLVGFMGNIRWNPKHFSEYASYTP